MTEWAEVDPKQLIRVVKGFKTKQYSPDYNRCMVFVLLEEVIEEISCPLARIVNTCLSEDWFPDALKVIIVVLVYKKRVRSFNCSYHPISIIPAIAKIC